MKTEIETLFEAVEIDDFFTVEKILNNGVSDVFINKTHILCVAKSEAMVDRLIKYGANLEAESTSFNFDVKPVTPLVAAWSEGHVEVVLALLKHKAKLIEGVDLTKTLFDAVKNNDLNSVNKLLDMNLSVDSRYGSYEYTPLHVAITKEMAQLLIKRNAKIEVWSNPDHRLIEKRSPLHVASAEGRMGVVEALVELGGANINLITSLGNTALHFACERKQSTLALQLISYGADINVKRTHSASNKKQPLTPLDIACKYALGKVVVVLLKKNAHSDENTQFWIPLFAAVQKNDIQMVNELLDSGISVRSVNEYGQQVLHVAETKEMALLLIQRGADMLALSKVCRENKEQFLPIHAASKAGRDGIIEALLDQGIDINSPTSLDKTALQIACQYAPPRTVLTLLRKGAQGNENTKLWIPLFTAVKENDGKLVTGLLDSGISIKSVDAKGRQVLHVVKTKEMTELLIQRGADVQTLSQLDPQTNEQFLPIQTAIQHGLTGVIEILLENGVDINSAITKSKTAFHTVGKSKNNQNLVEEWPLDVAALSGNDRLFTFLLEKGACYAPDIQLQIYMRAFNELSEDELVNNAKNYTQLLALWETRKQLTKDISKAAESFKTMMNCYKNDALFFLLEKNRKDPLSIKNTIDAMESHLEFIENLQKNFKKYNDELKKEIIVVLKALVYYKYKFFLAGDNITTLPEIADTKKKTIYVSPFKPKKNIYFFNKANINIDENSLHLFLKNDEYRNYPGLDTNNYWYLCFAGLHSFGPIDYKLSFVSLPCHAIGDSKKYLKNPGSMLFSTFQDAMYESQCEIELLDKRRQEYFAKVERLQQCVRKSIQKLNTITSMPSYNLL